MNEQEKANVKKLLDAWEWAERGFIYERSCNIERDIDHLEDRKEEWKKLFGLD